MKFKINKYITYYYIHVNIKMHIMRCKGEFFSLIKYLLPKYTENRTIITV